MTEHLLNFAFLMNDLLSAAESYIPAFRNSLGFCPWWGQSRGDFWKWEFCPPEMRERNGKSQHISWLSSWHSKTLTELCYYLRNHKSINL